METHETNNNISDTDNVEDPSEKTVDTLSKNESSSPGGEEDRVYPPTGQVVLIMLSLSAAMFLVALVGPTFTHPSLNLISSG